jgi:uncharacterized protein involved in exopolysaccharide biosynthesis
MAGAPLTDRTQDPPDRQSAHEHESGNAQMLRAYIVPEAQPDTQPISIDALISSVSRAWRWWLAGLLIGAALAASYAFLARPIYRSQVVLAVVPQSNGAFAGSFIERQLGGLAGLAGLAFGERDRSHESIAVLRSRELAELFINEENLIPVLFWRDWDSTSGRWRIDDPPTIEDAYKLFDERIRRVSEDRRTGLVTLSIDWFDRELAARWANAFVQRADALLRDRAVREARASLAFLERELTRSTQIELRQAVYQLIEAQKKQEMLATVREDFAFRVIDSARIADADHFERPKRGLIIVAGALVGLLAGLILGLRRT